MKVLWFEVTEPSVFNTNGIPIGGWQDSLQQIVSSGTDLELCIAFMSNDTNEERIINGVIYKPIFAKLSFIERYFKKYWDVYVEKLLPAAKNIINDFKPDIIHIFGTEWPFGQIAKHTDIPIVIHIQGSIIPYNNALYPPNYSLRDSIRQCGINPIKHLGLWKLIHNTKNREKWENDSWKNVSCYMGRTEWDKSLSNIMHPGRKYFHVEEALRTVFTNGGNRWKGITNKNIKLISTGCGSFWKGPDMMLKVARILKNHGVNFEWDIVGDMPVDLRRIVERKEKTKFKDCNINITGWIKPDKLVEKLETASIYIHTAYIENSPNSICEAQYLGVPIISTNVGGISTLVRNHVDGILVPANDPWQMAEAIIELFRNKELMQEYSTNSQNIAKSRHNPTNILSQLMNCYNTIIMEHEKVS